MIKKLLSKFTLDVFIEFGSYELKIFIPKFSKFETFLSVIALDDSHTKYQLVEQYYNPIIKKNLKLFYPFKGGTIVDYHSAEIRLKLAMEKMLEGVPIQRKLLGIDYYVSLHSTVSEVQISAISDILHANGGNQITYVHESVCVAKNLEFKKDNKNRTDRQIVCHIGHSVTELLAIEGTNVIGQDLIRLGVRSIQKDLQTFILEKYQCIVSDETIHNLFFEPSLKVGTKADYEVTGKHINNGKPNKFKLNNSEFQAIVKSSLHPVVTSLDSMVASLPTSFTDTLQSNGIHLSGGASNIECLKSYFQKELGLKMILKPGNKQVVVDGLYQISQNPLTMDELQVKDFVML